VIIFDTDQKMAARRVREGHTILDQFSPIGCLAQHGTQRFPVEQLSLLAHRQDLLISVAINKPKSHQPQNYLTTQVVIDSLPDTEGLIESYLIDL